MSNGTRIMAREQERKAKAMRIGMALQGLAESQNVFETALRNLATNVTGMLDKVNIILEVLAKKALLKQGRLTDDDMGILKEFLEEQEKCRIADETRELAKKLASTNSSEPTSDALSMEKTPITETPLPEPPKL